MVYHSESKSIGKVLKVKDDKVEVRLNEENKEFDSKDLKGSIKVQLRICAKNGS